MDDLSQFKDLFIETSSEHVVTLTSLLKKYEESHEAMLIDDMHLHLHSLKGEALAMKYTKLGEYVTILEGFVKSIKTSNSVLSEDKIKIINDSLSVLVSAIEYIKSEKYELSDLEVKSESLKQQLQVPV